MKCHFKGFMCTSFLQLLLSPTEPEPSALALRVPQAGHSSRAVVSRVIHGESCWEGKGAPTMHWPKMNCYHCTELQNYYSTHTYLIMHLTNSKSASLMLKCDIFEKVYSVLTGKVQHGVTCSSYFGFI